MKIASINNFNNIENQKQNNVSFGKSHVDVRTLKAFTSNSHVKKAKLTTRMLGAIITPISDALRRKNPNGNGFIQRNLGIISDDLQKIIKNPEEASLATKFMAKGLGHLFETSIGQNAVKGMSKLKNVAVGMGQLASWLLTFNRIRCTYKSDKIEEERKPPLMLNDLLVTVVSSILSVVVDKVSDVAIHALENASFAVYKDDYKQLGKQEGLKALKKINKMIRKAKSLTIFTLVVRFAVPVLMVPIVSSIIDKIKDSKEKKENEIKQARANAVIQHNAQFKPASFDNFFTASSNSLK